METQHGLDGLSILRYPHFLRISLSPPNMHDPLPPPDFLVKATEPLAKTLSLRTLPSHGHEILLAFCTYEFVNRVVSPLVSARLFPKSYPQMPRKTKINWNVHFVSMVQSCVINSAALWVIFADGERSRMGAMQRVWGYTGASGMVQGFSAGYFLWDLITSIEDVDVHGWGALIHAASALAVTCLGFVGLRLGVMESRSNCLKATFCKLLWCQPHTLRVINAFSQYPLVHG